MRAPKRARRATCTRPWNDGGRSPPKRKKIARRRSRSSESPSRFPPTCTPNRMRDAPRNGQHALHHAPCFAWQRMTAPRAEATRLKGTPTVPAEGKWTSDHLPCQVRPAKENGGNGAGGYNGSPTTIDESYTSTRNGARSRTSSATGVSETACLSAWEFWRLPLFGEQAQLPVRRPVRTARSPTDSTYSVRTSARTAKRPGVVSKIARRNRGKKINRCAGFGGGRGGVSEAHAPSREGNSFTTCSGDLAHSTAQLSRRSAGVPELRGKRNKCTKMLMLAKKKFRRQI